eukprot:763280-Hanusia_phi.AAC.1
MLNPVFLLASLLSSRTRSEQHIYISKDMYRLGRQGQEEERDSEGRKRDENKRINSPSLH